ncbi:ATP-binding cassette domain-containing protein [Bacillus pinisoli]|uniref:ATP-binding cassette domain-containing protein n=1 Tax=Bacillus pinisoli TaxID=2901866 RepID=UPI001FF14EF8|nr:ABC transporter ATP-binding protein [Bacillus pinisoli]
MNVIECNEVTKVYGGTKAVNYLSFTIKENTITGLIGRNGAGKSTILKLIAGHIKISSGELRVFSEQPFNSLKVSSNLMFVDENMVFPNSISLAAILKEVGKFYANWDEELANRLFQHFSFKENDRYDRLSKGKKSTFHFIVGLAARCSITIFDEPVNGMDASVRKDFYRAILKDYIDHPRTIIISSHLLTEMENLLEDILLIKDGEKCLHMSVPRLKEYAIGLTGASHVIEEWTDRSTVLYKKSLPNNYVYVVIENQLSRVEREQAKSNGVEFTQVSAEELCMMLTGNMTGGIDDVFNRN